MIHELSMDANSTEADDIRLLQSIWDLRIGHEEYLSSPLFPVILSIAFYIGSCLPFTAMDMFCAELSWYKKYKIQPGKVVTGFNFRDTVSLIVANHVFLILPASIAQWIWVPPTELPQLAPTVFEFLWQQMAGVFIFDFQYYVWHWSHHKVKFLYRHIHGLHHRYTSPFVWVAEYLHPWELITVGVFTTTNSWFFRSHPLTVWSYMLVIVWISVEAHIGFDFPYLLHNWCPFDLVGGAPKHDMHHQKPLTNYQPFFNHFDRLFGTYCPPMRRGGLKTKELLAYELRYRENKRKG